MTEGVLLGDMLRKIIDESNFHTRTEWAYILGERDPDAVGRWISNLEVPPPERLNGFHSTLMADTRFTALGKLKREWLDFIKRPIREVLVTTYSGPLAWWPYTLEEYMLIPLVTGFLRTLNTVPEVRQKRNVLYRASEHGRSIRGS